jgi:hypothetical protein
MTLINNRTYRIFHSESVYQNLHVVMTRFSTKPMAHVEPLDFRFGLVPEIKKNKIVYFTYVKAVY